MLLPLGLPTTCARAPKAGMASRPTRSRRRIPLGPDGAKSGRIAQTGTGKDRRIRLPMIDLPGPGRSRAHAALEILEPTASSTPSRREFVKSANSQASMALLIGGVQRATRSKRSKTASTGDCHPGRADGPVRPAARSAQRMRIAVIDGSDGMLDMGYSRHRGIWRSSQNATNLLLSRRPCRRRSRNRAKFRRPHGSNHPPATAT